MKIRTWLSSVFPAPVYGQQSALAFFPIHRRGRTGDITELSS